MKNRAVEEVHPFVSQILSAKSNLKDLNLEKQLTLSDNRDIMFNTHCHYTNHYIKKQELYLVVTASCLLIGIMTTCRSCVTIKAEDIRYRLKRSR